MVAHGWSRHGVSVPVGTPDFEGSAVNWNVAIGVRIYPFIFGGRFEPYAGVLVGFNKYSEELGDDDSPADDDYQRELYRGVHRFQLGLDILLDEHISVGPMISFDPQWGGQQCWRDGDNAARQCRDISDSGRTDPIGGSPEASKQPQFMEFLAAFRWRL
jgi:hypothetical protein